MTEAATAEAAAAPAPKSREPSDIQSDINEIAVLFNKKQIEPDEYNTKLTELRQELDAANAERTKEGEPGTGNPQLPPDAIAQQMADKEAAEKEAKKPADAPEPAPAATLSTTPPDDTDDGKHKRRGKTATEA